MKSINYLLKRAQNEGDGFTSLPTVKKVHLGLERLGGVPASYLTDQGPDRGVLNTDMYDLTFFKRNPMFIWYLDDAIKKLIPPTELEGRYVFRPKKRLLRFDFGEGNESIGSGPFIYKIPLNPEQYRPEIGIEEWSQYKYPSLWLPLSKKILFGAGPENQADYVLSALFDKAFDFDIYPMDKYLFGKGMRHYLNIGHHSGFDPDLVNTLTSRFKTVVQNTPYFDELAEYVDKEGAYEAVRLLKLRGARLNADIAPNPFLSGFYNDKTGIIDLFNPSATTLIHEVAHSLFTPDFRAYKQKNPELAKLMLIVGEGFATAFTLGAYAHLFRRASQDPRLRPETRNVARYLYERAFIPLSYGYVIPLKNLESLYERFSKVKTKDELIQAVNELKRDPMLLAAFVGFGSLPIPKKQDPNKATMLRYLRDYFSRQNMDPFFLRPWFEPGLLTEESP